MSLVEAVPNVFTPGFMMKRPANVSQPLSRRSPFSTLSRHCWMASTYSGAGALAGAVSAAETAAEITNDASVAKRDSFFMSELLVVLSLPKLRIMPRSAVELARDLFSRHVIHALEMF